MGWQKSHALPLSLLFVRSYEFSRENHELMILSMYSTDFSSDG